MEIKSSASQPNMSLKLAVIVLFGEQFLLNASPAFLLSLEQNADAWGKLLLNLWEITHSASMPVPPVPSNGYHAFSEAFTETQDTNFVADPLPASVTQQEKYSSSHVSAVSPASGGRAVPSSSLQVDTAFALAELQVFDPKIDGPLEVDTRQKNLSPAEIKSHLIELLVEKTGYPAEVFEDHLDFEADLGIDSVKQLEIMSIMREEYQLPVDEDFLLRDYTTIQTAVDYIVAQMKA